MFLLPWIGLVASVFSDGGLAEVPVIGCYWKFRFQHCSNTSCGSRPSKNVKDVPFNMLV